MKDNLAKLGYIFSDSLLVWARPDFSGIDCNDGDETERRIAGVISNARDVSVLSTELRKHITDGASLYHLGSIRSNIMRPFENILKGDVLEIGAGCGAITRYLAECGGNILAIEARLRRAAIVRSRTRGFENVTVLANNLDLFQSDCQFDVITLIGVLEYANLFMPGEEPALTMLERVRLMLKAEGKLIIGIDNQLGLKHFAGAIEDPLGQSMVGIEGRCRKDQSKTFGRMALKSTLEKAGFAVSEFLFPFPNYRFPVSILTEEGLSTKNFDAAAFGWQSVGRDPQLPPSCSFSLELAWSEVFKNKFAGDVANSFLVISGLSMKKHIPKGVLAYHYNVDRIPAYCKQSTFFSNHEGNIRVKYRRLAASDAGADQTDTPLISNTWRSSDEYVSGTSLALEFVHIVTKDGWRFDEVARFVRHYLAMVEKFLKSAGMEISTSSVHQGLPGDFFDVIPQNIIVGEDGIGYPIDREWKLAISFELGHLLFRSFIQLLSLVTRFGQHESGESMTRWQFIHRALERAGLAISEIDCVRYIKLESAILDGVTGVSPEGHLTCWKDEPLSALTLSQVVPEQERQITRLNEALTERDEQITRMLNSMSWRVTKTLRFIEKSLTGLKNRGDS